MKCREKIVYSYVMQVIEYEYETFHLASLSEASSLSHVVIFGVHFWVWKAILRNKLTIQLVNSLSYTETNNKKSLT